jgi:outer membrane protein assembly factor BamB
MFLRRWLPPFAAAIPLMFAAPLAFAQDHWPQFRGADGAAASETRFPARWTDKDYRWKLELPGLGYSSPVVWGDRLYVTSANEENGTILIQCLNAASGAEVWQRKFEGTTYSKNKVNSYAVSTPAVDAERLYVTWASPKSYLVVALDRERGNEVWRKDFGPFVSQHGFGASPILFDGRLIVPNEQEMGSGVEPKSFIVALECKTGKVLWQTPRRTDRAAYATPCVFQPENGPPQLILSSSAHGVYSLEPTSGKVSWELPVFEKRVVGSPSLAAGLIFASAGEGGTGREMVAIRPGDAVKNVQASVAYKIPTPIPYVPTAVAKGPLVFLWHDNGMVTCLDAASGKLRWRERVGGSYHGSPVRAGDRIYCMSREGDMAVVAAAEKYELLARFPLGDRSQSTPAIAGGTMYLRTATHLMALPAEAP